MEPLRIEFDLVTPMVVPKRPLHLDALLAFARVDEALTAKDPEALSYQEELPLAVHRQGDDWVWKASQLAFTAAPLAEVHAVAMTRPLTLDQIASDNAQGKWSGKLKKLAMGTGPFKGYDLRLFVRQYDRAIAFCIGDKSEIERLLGRLTHLGSTRRNDWGRIEKVAVEVDPKAEEQWKARALPSSMAGLTMAGHHPGTVTIRAPYWDRRNWQDGFEFAPSPTIPAVA
jgi:CRISPR type IV-associated protein Csf3